MRGAVPGRRVARGRSEAEGVNGWWVLEACGSCTGHLSALWPQGRVLEEAVFMLSPKTGLWGEGRVAVVCSGPGEDVGLWGVGEGPCRIWILI